MLHAPHQAVPHSVSGLLPLHCTDRCSPCKALQVSGGCLWPACAAPAGHISGQCACCSVRRLPGSWASGSAAAVLFICACMQHRSCSICTAQLAAWTLLWRQMRHRAKADTPRWPRGGGARTHMYSRLLRVLHDVGRVPLRVLWSSDLQARASAAEPPLRCCCRSGG